MGSNLSELPKDLPRPTDDGAADHLQDLALPDVTLPAPDGSEVRLAGLPGRGVRFVPGARASDPGGGPIALCRRSARAWA